jgi:hypothetical protein
MSRITTGTKAKASESALFERIASAERQLPNYYVALVNTTEALNQG